MRKTIEKIFENMWRGDVLEVGIMSNLYSDLDNSFAYELCRVRGEVFRDSKAIIDARKNKFGYSINEFLEPYDVDVLERGFGPSKEAYSQVGFSFTKKGADRKAHDYVLKIARQVAEKHGLRIVDKSAEEIAKAKEDANRELEKYMQETQ